MVIMEGGKKGEDRPEGVVVVVVLVDDDDDWAGR